MDGNDNYGYGYGQGSYGYGYDYNSNYNYQQQSQGTAQSPPGGSQFYGGFTNYPASATSPSSNVNANNNPQHQAPNFNEFLNNPAAQIGVQFGAQALSAGQQYVNTNINRWLSVSLLREYFNVTNGYVFRKLSLIFFPFIQKNWKRSLKQNPSTGQIDGYLQPRDDVNAPDLYIPTMAVVSYIILVGLMMGMRNAFHPEILGVTATSCVMSLCLEAFLIKLGCYIFSLGGEIHFLDFFAYAGYKFCILIASAAASAFGSRVKHAVFGYCALSFGFFLIRSLRPVFLPESADALIVSQRRRRINFLLGVVGLELLSSYILLK